MSEFKGTPATWEYKASSSDAHKRISTSEGVLMSSDYPFSQIINATEHDWKLIAAAPDLLEALTKILPYAQEHCDDGPWNAKWKSNEFKEILSMSEKAIAKALGEAK